jgi:hypothetical protein
MVDIVRAARDRFNEDDRCDAAVGRPNIGKLKSGRCYRTAYYFIDSGHGFNGQLYCRQHAEKRRYVAGGTIRSL